MQNVKLLRAAFLLLLSVNILLAGLLLIGGKDVNDAKEGDRKPALYLIRQLNFTSSQQQAYELLIAAHKRQRQIYIQQITVARERLYGSIASCDSSIAESIKEIQYRIEMLNYNHFMHVRNICTESQQNKFDSIIVDVLKMMAEVKK